MIDHTRVKDWQGPGGRSEKSPLALLAKTAIIWLDDWCIRVGGLPSLEDRSRKSVYWSLQTVDVTSLEASKTSSITLSASFRVTALTSRAMCEILHWSSQPARSTR